MGTSTSRIGYWTDHGFHLIKSLEGSEELKSHVMIDSTGSIVVGNKVTTDPKFLDPQSIVITSAKRYLASKEFFNNQHFSTYPQEIYALVIAELVAAAEVDVGSSITEAVIAIPAHFTENQRRITKEAAQAAGLEVKRLLNEATAAALSFSYERNFEGKVLVIDFGAGTIDLSLVEVNRSDNYCEVLSTAGNSQIGGDNLNELLYDFALKQYKETSGYSVEITPVQSRILHEEVERAKIELSSVPSASIDLPGFVYHNGEYHRFQVEISKGQFVGLLEEAFQPVKKLIGHFATSGYNPDVVLLVGGTSQIPYFRIVTSHIVNCEIYTPTDWQNYVVKGAAFQASIIEKKQPWVLFDVLPSSYGIKLYDESISAIIPKDTQVPVRKHRIYSINKGNKEWIDIPLFQSADDNISDPISLGRFRIALPKQKEAFNVKLTFEVDVDMIIQVKAEIYVVNDDNIPEKTPLVQRTYQLEHPYGLNYAQHHVLSELLGVYIQQRKLAVTGLQQQDSVHDIFNNHLRKLSPVLQRELQDAVHQAYTGDIVQLVETCTQQITQYDRASTQLKELDELIISFLDEHVAKIQASIPLLMQQSQVIKDLVDNFGRIDVLQDCLQETRHVLATAVQDIVLDQNWKQKLQDAEVIINE